MVSVKMFCQQRKAVSFTSLILSGLLVIGLSGCKPQAPPYPEPGNATLQDEAFEYYAHRDGHADFVYIQYWGYFWGDDRGTPF